MEFEFYIGGYPGPFFKLELSGTVLKCYETPKYSDEASDEIIVVEGNPEWQELLNFLSTRKWKKEYWTEAVDGTQWELRVTGHGINIDSHGSNAFPPGFWKFLRLLNDVVFEAGMVVH